jgi:RND superfamily putative drug exporter
MDYEVFLVSRMRENYVHTGNALESTVTGFQASARVVTAAALIMIAVFSGFIISDDVVIKSIGFALAFGVLVDAFLVRMTLVPAVLAMLDRRAWWLPAWLDRRMPNLDIEGEKLLHELEPPSPGEPEQPPAPVPG